MADERIVAEHLSPAFVFLIFHLSEQVQEAALRSRPDIVVATPGRMIDHLHNAQSVGLEELSVLILDEADRLLELGFTKEVHELVRFFYYSSTLR
jgi:superfamily II DNA/RNA helicase